MKCDRHGPSDGFGGTGTRQIWLRSGILTLGKPVKFARAWPFSGAALVAVLVLGLVAGGQVSAQCVPIGGGKLKIKPAADNVHSRFSWKAKDKSLDFLIADPTSGTTTVQMLVAGTVAATIAFDQSAAPAWRSSGNPVRAWRYRYRNDPSPIDGIEKIKSKEHSFQLKGKDGIIDLVAAPLALPVSIQVTDSAGACYVSHFTECDRNDDRLIKCKQTPQSLPDVPNLVFHSGFEIATIHQYTTVPGVPCTDDLFGTDYSVDPPGHWEDHPDGGLEGGAFSKFHFCFGGGDRNQRLIDLVPDPVDPSNVVLYGRIDEPNEIVNDDPIACNGEGAKARKARIHAVLETNPNVTRIDYRVRMRLGDAFNEIVAADQKITWMTIAELWNDKPAFDDTFRVTLNLVKQAVAGEPLVFGLKADRQDDGSSTWIDVWPSGWPGSDVEAPIGEWFTLEFTFIEGNASTGRAYVRMTDAAGVTRTIADVTNWTYSPGAVPDGFQTLNPLKLYTSGVLMCALHDAPGGAIPLEIWWDDFAIGTPD